MNNRSAESMHADIVIPSSLNDPVAARSQVGLADLPTIVATGPFDDLSHAEELADAFALMRQRYTAQLVLLRTGRQRTAVVRRTFSQGVGADVHLVRSFPTGRWSDIVAAADVVVPAIASETAHLLDVLAVGRAVVARVEPCAWSYLRVCWPVRNGRSWCWARVPHTRRRTYRSDSRAGVRRGRFVCSGQLNPHPSETTRTPNRKTTPKRLPVSTRILALVGSLRSGSDNRHLAEAAVKLAPGGASVEIFDGLADVHFYNEDIDQPGAVAAADRTRRGSVGRRPSARDP